GDIASYRAKPRAPLCGSYRAYRICGMGPPSSGGFTVLMILKQLERFNMAKLGKASPVAWHLFAESSRLAYADRDMYVGDPDFDIVPDKDGYLVANRVAPGKRPRSSMAPTIVYGPDGKVRLAIGAAGGSTIIAQVAKAIVAVVDWKMSAQDAIGLGQVYAPGP